MPAAPAPTTRTSNSSGFSMSLDKKTIIILMIKHGEREELALFLTLGLAGNSAIAIQG